MNLQTARGERISSPTTDDVNRAFADASAEDSILILERSATDFVQVFGDNDSGFVVEHRNGAAHDNLTDGADAETARAVFQAFLAGAFEEQKSSLGAWEPADILLL